MLIIQAVATALLSGLFSGAILFALNERRDRRAIHLLKIESTIEAYLAWQQAIERWPVAHFRLFKTGLLEVAQADLGMLYKESSIYLNKTKVLIGIYLPEKRHLIGELLKSYADFIEVSRAIQTAAIEGKTFPFDQTEKINETGRKIIKAGSDGLDELLDAARSHAQAPYLVRLPRRKRGG
jgi:hypothetical protein